MPETPPPPVAPRRPMPREHHGDAFIDDFAWMKDKQDPEFLALLEAETAYAEAATEHLEGLRNELFEDLRARTQETDLSVPSFVRHSDGSTWWYYSRTIEGRQYEMHCRLPAGDPDHLPDLIDVHPEEQVLLDENVLAVGQEFFALGHCDVSPDGTRLAYSVDLVGDERYHLIAVDLADGRELAAIPDVGGGGCWAGNDALIYSRVDDAWRPFQLWRHHLGGARDDLVAEEPDERFWVSADESRDRRWVIIELSSKDSSECLLLDAWDPAARPRIVAERRPGIECSVEVGGDQLYLVHNDGAVEFCLAQAPITATGPGEWRTVVPERPGVRLLAVAAYRRWLVLSVRREGLPGVEVVPLTSDGDLGEPWSVMPEEPLYSLFAESADDPDADRVRLNYQSLVSPPRVEELRLDTGGRTVLKQTPVLDHPRFGRYSPSDYVQRREWAIAADGARIPLSIVHRRGLARDGQAPALLYGYGAYEISIPDRFSIARLSLLDRGFVYAVAHVRGGGELGRTWYAQGRREAKPNSFSDFVACARRLVELGYTSADRLVAQGGSAGGLLIGAALNLAPDAFAAVHADVPFVDALTTILDPSLPLTVTEWDEWGDPLHDAAAYQVMKSYTPYENVRSELYPAILVTGGLHDTRVEITEPAKWVSQLRRTVTNGPDRPVLFRVQTHAGHGGASGRYQAWHDSCFEQAWMIDRVAPATASHPGRSPGTTTVSI